MFKIIIITAIMTLVMGAAVPPGMLPQLDGRIVGGTATSISKYPHQISLQRNGYHSCGGSIYNNEIIVTAAHCVKGVSASALMVRAGSGYWNTNGVYVKVANLKYHPLYDSATMVNDVAVLRLASPLVFSSYIKSIPLATAVPANGTLAVVTGWGTMSSGASTIPDQLRQVNVYIIRRAICASADYGYGTDILETMVCAGDSGKDSCQGDSGGPLVADGLLVGIVSWGYGCAAPSYPGVYASVPALNGWITTNAGLI